MPTDFVHHQVEQGKRVRIEGVRVVFNAIQSMNQPTWNTMNVVLPETEQFRQLAEETRKMRDQHREAVETIRQETRGTPGRGGNRQSRRGDAQTAAEAAVTRR